MTNLYDLLRNYLADICDKIEEGTAEPLKEYAALYFFNKDTNDFQTQLKEYAEADAEVFNKKELKELGWVQKSGGKIYKYEHIDKIETLRKELKAEEERAKLIANAFESGNENIILEHCEKLKVDREGLRAFAAETSLKRDSFYPDKKLKH